jgi:hypothetical protein
MGLFRPAEGKLYFIYFAGNAKYAKPCRMVTVLYLVCAVAASSVCTNI